MVPRPGRLARLTRARSSNAGIPRPPRNQRPRGYTRRTPARLNMSALSDRLRQERTARGYSLADVAIRAGISRSMVSAVARGAKVPTVLVLDCIATALDTSIGRLVGEPQQARVVVLRHADQHVVRDPAGWERRILSPVRPGVEFEFMRTTIGPCVDAGTFAPHARGSREYVAIERGTLHLTIDGDLVVLRAGDSIYYDGDCHHRFENRGRTPCVYYLAMEVTPAVPARAIGHGESS